MKTHTIDKNPRNLTQAQSTELVNTLGYALFEREEEDNKNWKKWMDSRGLDIGDPVLHTWGQDAIDSVPSYVLWYVMQDLWEYAVLDTYDKVTDTYSEPTSEQKKEIIENWYEKIINIYALLSKHLVEGEWSSIKKQEYEHGEDDGYEEFHNKQFAYQGNSIGGDVGSSSNTDVCPLINPDVNPYVCANVDVSVAQSRLGSPVSVLPRRMYTCTGHMDIEK